MKAEHSRGFGLCSAPMPGDRELLLIAMMPLGGGLYEEGAKLHCTVWEPFLQRNAAFRSPESGQPHIVLESAGPQRQALISAG